MGALSRAGCVVFVNGRTGPPVEAAIGRLKSANPSSEFREAPGDLANAEGAKQVFDACASVDILVNNAGVFPVADFFAISDDDWRSILETNVMSGVRCSRHYMPKMLEQNWGR